MSFEKREAVFELQRLQTLQKINKDFLREYICADMRANFSWGFSLRIIHLGTPQGFFLRILRNNNEIRSAVKTSLVVHLQLLRAKVEDNHRHQTYRMLLRLTHLVQSNFRLFKTSMGKFPISFRASTIFNDSLSGRRGFMSSLVLNSETCILHIYIYSPPLTWSTFCWFPGSRFLYCF